MYNIIDIETYASWILDAIKKAKKNHKKVDMNKIKFWSSRITDFATQKIAFDEGKNIGKYGHR